jgi:hypothetical protein
MENVTRDVVSDLWPLYISGEASADTRVLVERYLAEDLEFARMLRGSSGDRLAVVTPPLTPDHELKTLARVKRRLTGPRPLLQLAMVFTMLAFGRIVSDTSFDVSPKNFIATAALAAIFWVAFIVRLFRGRREILVRVRR